MEFNKKILKYFKYTSDKKDLDELNLRAFNIQKKSGDLSLDPFILQMHNFDNSKEAAERILLNLLKKDPKHMNDNDIERVQILLSEIIDQFFKVETHAKISKRKYKSTSLSVLYGGSTKKEVHDFNFKLNPSEKRQAKKIAQNIESSVSEIINKNSQINMFDDSQKIILGAISEYLSNNIKLMKDE